MSKRRRNRGADLTNIDVTPLVDLTFMLLIVFMVAAPAMESHITIPVMGSAEQRHTDDVMINLNVDGEIIFKKRQITLEELQEELSVMNKANKAFSIRADESRKYGEVITLMRHVKNAGIENVNLVTLHEQ